jgi:hypothetical protein
MNLLIWLRGKEVLFEVEFKLKSVYWSLHLSDNILFYQLFDSYLHFAIELISVFTSRRKKLCAFMCFVIRIGL